MHFDTVGLIVAAGRGERAGGPVPKQFLPLLGVPVVARAIDALAPMPVFVVIGDHQHDQLAAALGSRIVTGVVPGGETRRQSVALGLEAIAAQGGARRVLIHDAARPLLPAAVIGRLLAALDTHDAAVPVLPVVDTLAGNGAVLGETVARDGLLRVQTPQAFRFDVILATHRSWPVGQDATDDAQMARATGVAVAPVPGDDLLDKITRPGDFARAETLLAARRHSRTATGFDVHRLEPGGALWLGGIRIDHTHGLAGHSDADVALHALTDALLGTIAAGDIGTHFPPSEAQWRGASSDRFLIHARDLIRAAEGRLDHVDLTLICEAPRIGPYREPIRERIGDLLQLPVARVSVKATTTERLGFTGRGEGIAAQATATASFWELEH